MLTPAQITGATTIEALTRLGLQVQDAAYEDQRATNAKYVAALEAEAATRLNKKQQLWFELYQAHLKARKDPAVITSVTADAVVRDVALDAAMMTAAVWPEVKAAMAAMEVPPGGVDWS